MGSWGEPSLKTTCPWARGQGGQRTGGNNLGCGPGPAGDTGLFLNPFLPLLASAGCQERQGKQWAGPGRARGPNHDDFSRAAFDGCL